MPQIQTENAHSDPLIQQLDKLLVRGENNAVPFGRHGQSLRLSQVEALEATRRFLQSGETLGHIVMPGGSGKTRLGIALAHAAFGTGRKSLFVVPSQQALTDFADKAADLFPEMNIGKVYEGEKRLGNLTFITYASLMRRITGDDMPDEVKAQEAEDHSFALAHGQQADPKKLRIDPASFDMVAWDEAHMYLTQNAQDLLSRFSHAVNIGLTATPRYYEGKEVANVFGELIYNLPHELAVERGEMCDTHSLMVNTGERTGLKLDKPDREESPTVAKALNRPSRNRLVADIYADMVITHKQKKHRLLGEPAIVFGTTVQHVNDIADAINDELMPRLKTDKKFRQLLRDKGIDPDQVEAIAAPIHASGNTGRSGLSPREEKRLEETPTEELRHELENRGVQVDPVRPLPEAMSLKARSELVEKYHQRKVLMLVSTSLLQQSFDSPQTSVVIDTVPRQTYVGCGQAGMRATRPGKEVAFVINMCDKDHPSISFSEFQALRAHNAEDGVKMEIDGDGRTHSREYYQPSAHEIASGAEREGIQIIEGRALDALITKRITDKIRRAREEEAARLKKQLQKEAEPKHFRFKKQDFARCTALLEQIQGGDKSAVKEFLTLLAPWLEFSKKRFVRYALTLADDVSEDAISEILEDTLYTKIEKCLNREICFKRLGGSGRSFISSYSTTAHNDIKAALSAGEMQPLTEKIAQNLVTHDRDSLTDEELRYDAKTLTWWDSVRLSNSALEAAGVPEGGAKNRRSADTRRISYAVVEGKLPAVAAWAVDKGLASQRIANSEVNAAQKKSNKWQMDKRFERYGFAQETKEQSHFRSEFNKRALIDTRLYVPAANIASRKGYLEDSIFLQMQSVQGAIDMLAPTRREWVIRNISHFLQPTHINSGQLRYDSRSIINLYEKRNGYQHLVSHTKVLSDLLSRYDAVVISEQRLKSQSVLAESREIKQAFKDPKVQRVLNHATAKAELGRLSGELSEADSWVWRKCKSFMDDTSGNAFAWLAADEPALYKELFEIVHCHAVLGPYEQSQIKSALERNRHSQEGHLQRLSQRLGNIESFYLAHDKLKMQVAQQAKLVEALAPAADTDKNRGR